MFFIVISNIIGIIVIGRIISYTRKSNREFKNNHEEYSKPDNIFKRQSEKLGYTPILFTDRKKYPYILIPSYNEFKKGKNVDKFNFTNNIKIGRSEKILYELLKKTYGTELIKGAGEYNYYGYFPDIAYINTVNRIFIDIEIDEMYDLKTKSPIHYYDKVVQQDGRKWVDSNYDRDNVFQKYGWTVIRFSEEQVLKQGKECLNIIAYVLAYWNRQTAPHEMKSSPIKIIERWDSLTSKEHSAKNHRDKIYNEFLNEDFLKSNFDKEFLDPSGFILVKPKSDNIQ